MAISQTSIAFMWRKSNVKSAYQLFRVLVTSLTCYSVAREIYFNGGSERFI